jgi:hypothetical protein
LGWYLSWRRPCRAKAGELPRTATHENADFPVTLASYALFSAAGFCAVAWRTHRLQRPNDRTGGTPLPPKLVTCVRRLFAGTDIIRAILEKTGSKGRSPGRGPGFEHCWRLGQPRSSGLIERLCDACLQWLRARERNSPGKGSKLFSLLSERLGLCTYMFSRKLYEFRRRLYAGQLLDKVKCNIGVCVSKLHELIIVFLRSLKRRRTTCLD